MDALKNLVTNCPGWVKRLDELNGQIEQRQIELAQLADSQSSSSPGRSLRSRSSTESPKPKDEPEAHSRLSPPSRDASRAPQSPLEKPAREVTREQNRLSSPVSHRNSQTPSAPQRQTNAVMELAQSRARAALRKRQRTESVVSAEGAATKRCSCSTIIVYYDSYVQRFFEELVKFVSASRSLMRKAKMAAKVAQIKRMAELEIPDETDEEEADSGSTKTLQADKPLEVALKKGGEAHDSEELPTLQYVSTRRMRPVFRVGAGMVDQPPDVYDELDKGLDGVQSMCEHAAHQFLRDGDCTEEVDNIKQQLTETKGLADKEMQRILADPAAAEATIEEPQTPSLCIQGSTSGELEVDEDMNAKDSELAFKSEDDTGLSAEYLKARRTQNDTELASHKVREDDVGVARADVCLRGGGEAAGEKGQIYKMSVAVT
ncbi:hypothetical protein NKR23_g12100 [Pleurostoma richardsiae]|uniref:Uncharacterized protein n=1 Tax=Pleurostoma richardsiae TaxID=41990 RepID=A0AA38R0M8_9PEZI|nr:hypothetical protein NKR23_g12100 [Pleurostoma richardsiae]